MPKSKLSSAYKTAGKAAGAYQASLYDVANIGYQREASAQMAGIKAQDRSRAVGMISEGIDLVGNVARRGQRREEERLAAKSIGATEQKRTLWEKLGGKERMYEREGGVVSGADVMAHYKLQQQEKAFGQSVTVDKDTGKATATPAEKKTPEIPTGPPPKVDKETGEQRQPGPWADEYTMPKEEPTMAKEAGLNVTGEELEKWKTGSGSYDPGAGKSALTQYANWQKSGSPGGIEGFDERFGQPSPEEKLPTWKTLMDR